MADTPAKSSRRGVSCNLRGVVVDGAVWPWPRVRVVRADLIRLEDESGRKLDQVAVGLALLSLLKRAQRRWFDQHARSKSLEYVEHTDGGWRAITGLIVIALCIVFPCGALVFHGASSLAAGSTGEGVFLLVFATVAVLFFGLVVIRPAWSGRARRVRVHPGGVEVTRPGGRTESAAWAEVRRVRTCFGLTVELHHGGGLALPGESSRTRDAILAYRPQDRRVTFRPARTFGRIMIMFAIGAVVIPLAAWAAGERGERLLATMLAVPAMALPLALIFAADRTSEARWRRERASRRAVNERPGCHFGSQAAK